MNEWRRLSILRMRFRSLFKRRQVDRELEKELRFHLEQEAEEGCTRGLPQEEARYGASRRLGGIAQIQEECRDMRRTNFLERLHQDLRYAVRVWKKSPGFATVMILTLALSIGATSAIASVIEGVLLRALPYQEPARLVRVFTRCAVWPKFPLNPFDFRDFRSRVHCFESFAAYTRQDVQMAGTGEAIRLSGFSVTAGFFHVLGLKPAIGREFDTRDELPGKGRVAIVSNEIWKTWLAGRPDAVGQKIRLDDVPYTVVGIMPPGVRHPGNMYRSVAYGQTVDVWMPFTFAPPEGRGSHYMEGIARLRPGITLAQAQDEMNAAMRQLAREHPDNATGWSVMLIPLQKEIVGRSEQMLFVLMGAVALVLLIACVNAANLLLARATSRQREIAVRAAIGASRERIVRQLLTESMLLALIGAAVGAALAAVGVKILISLLPADFPRAGDIHVDSGLLLFTLFVAVATGTLFGIVPAFNASRTDLRGSLHETGRNATGSRQTLRLRNGLVVSEVTLACVLLMGAGLLLRSFLNLLGTDPGFRPEHVVTASISLPHASYKDGKATALFSARLLAELRGSEEFSAVGMGSDLPWTGWDDNTGDFQIHGEPSAQDRHVSARYHSASSGYFQALGIPVIRGRVIEDSDKADRRKVLVINQAMARYWQHSDPLGGKITFEDHPKESDWWTVVGIVGDIKDAPNDAGAKAAFWWAYQQAPFVNVSVVARSNLEPVMVADRIRAAVRELDGNLAVSDIRTMKDIASDSYSTSRFALALVALFAILALVLAAIGTYGVIAYSVNQRIHEFGVRMALGAKAGDLVRDVLASGMKLVVFGTVLGTVLGLGFSRLLSSLLYRVTAADPLAICGACGSAIVIAALACSVPAVRATRADPMAALRAD